MLARGSRAASVKHSWTGMDVALVLDPQPADVQDRDEAVPMLRLSRRTFPCITKAFADACYAGDRPGTATIITVEIVRKPPG